jgi:hypothetical protein
MSSMKHRLRLAGSFAVLATLVAGVACRGFFTKPILTSIAISPTAPQVEVAKTQQLQVFGTFDDGSRNQVRSGISWSSSDPTIASIDVSGGILTGVKTGTTTITASAQGLSSTATATVFLSGVTAIIVTPKTNSVSVNSGSPANYTAAATANGTQIDITGNATWTLNPTSANVTCSFVSPNEECSATGDPGTYTITVSYPGTTVVGTATLTVN